MKNIVKNKIYCLKKNQKLLMTSKKAGEKAKFESFSNIYIDSLVLGDWENQDYNLISPCISCKRYEFFKIFTDKKL